MNNSLSKKWNEFKSNKIAEPAPTNQKDMSSTMNIGPSGSLIGAGRATVVPSSGTNLTGSLGGAGAGAGASN